MDHAHRIENLRAQLGGPRDGALLRYSLGTALLAAGDAPGAATQLRAALAFNANYSAAWKRLGKACLANGDAAAAAESWRQGIAVAEAAGDVQAAREMRVFLKRLPPRGASIYARNGSGSPLDRIVGQPPT